MKIKLLHFWLALLPLVGLVSLCPQVAKAESLQALEAITRQFITFEEFRENAREVDRYYNAARLYFGPQLTRARFNSVLKRLDGSLLNIASAPVGRIWSMDSSESDSFTFDPDVPTFQHHMDQNAFSDYYRKLNAELRSTARSVFEVGGDVAQLNRVRRILGEVERTLSERRRELDGVNSADRDQLWRETVDRMRNDPDVKAADAYLTLRVLNRKETQTALGSQNADLILTELKRVRDGMAGAFSDLIRSPLPAEAGALLGGYLPNAETLIEDAKIFPKAAPSAGTRSGGGELTKSSYRFVSPPRLFHALFALELEGKLRRWHPLLDSKSLLQLVEKNGAYTGLAQVIHVRGWPTSKHPKYFEGGHGANDWGSLELTSSAFTDPVKIKDPTSGKEHSALLYEVWLKWANNRAKDRAWGGLILSESNRYNKAAVADVIRLGPAYQFGENLEHTYFGRSEEIDMVEQVHRVLRGKFWIAPAADALLPDAGTLVLLRPKLNTAFTYDDLVRLLAGMTSEHYHHLVTLAARSGVESEMIGWLRSAIETGGTPAVRLGALRVLVFLAKKEKDLDLNLGAFRKNIDSQVLALRTESASAVLRFAPNDVTAGAVLLKILKGSDFELIAKYVFAQQVLDVIRGFEHLPEMYEQALLQFLTEHRESMLTAGLRRQALEILVKHRGEDPQIIALATKIASTTKDEATLRIALDILPPLETPESIRLRDALLETGLTGKDEELRRVASRKAMQAGVLDKLSQKVFRADLTHKDYWVRSGALKFLASLSSPPADFYEDVFRLLLDGSLEVRGEAQKFLKQHPPTQPSDIARLTKLARNKKLDTGVSAFVASMVSTLPVPAAVPSSWSRLMSCIRGYRAASEAPPPPKE